MTDIPFPVSYPSPSPSSLRPSLPPSPSLSSTTSTSSSPSSTTTSTTSTSTSTSSSFSSTPTDLSSTTTTSSSTFSSTSSSSPTTTSSDDPQSSSSSTPIPLAASPSIPAPSSSSSLVVFPSTSSSPSPTAAHSSDLSFFSDTAAVAGTFTVVGLVSVAGVIAVILYFARRRQRSRSYYDDAEFLGKSPELSPDPPLPHIASHDDSGSSDQSHYGAPLALASPPVAYYPDHAYVFHPQAFSASGFPPPGSNDYAGHTQGYHPHHIHSPEVHIMDSAPRAHVTIPRPDRFTHTQLDFAPRNQVALTDALRPPTNTMLSVPNQEENRLSVDSFYSGIETDTPPHSGQAI